MASASMLLRAGYVVLLLLATLAPFQFQLDVTAALERLSRAFSPAYSPADFVDAVRNVALFAGWGAVWVVTASPGRARNVLRTALWSGLALSVAIEITQSLTPRRNSNILDVATNGLGALAGAALILMLVALTHALRHRKSHVGIPALLFAGPYVIAVALEATFAPFRLTPIPGVYGGPLARFRETLARFEWQSLYQIPVLDLLLFLPVGALVVAALVELGWSHRSAARATILMGAAGSVAAELLHGLLALPIELGAVLVHTVMIGTGAMIGAGALPALSRTLRGRRRPRYLFFLYTAVLLIWAWRPGRPDPAFEENSGISWRRFIPLQGSAPRLDLYSVADLAEGFLLFFPVGCLLAVWPLRRNGYLASYVPGVVVAVVGELGQPLIAGRYFDVTDILVEVAGMGIGWAVVRRSGYPVYGEMADVSTISTRAG